MKNTLFFILTILFAGCSSTERTDPDAVVREVRAMFDEYETSVERDGLLAEFAFLDSSENFFWVPPGFASAISYDSVRTVVTLNAQRTRSISLSWDTLSILPLNAASAVYTGVLSWTNEDTSGTVTHARIIETGVVIRREDGWKLLCGQSRSELINQNRR